MAALTGTWSGGTLTVPDGVPSGAPFMFAYGHLSGTGVTNPSGITPSYTRDLERSPSGQFAVGFGSEPHDGRSSYVWTGADASTVVGAYCFVTDADTSRTDWSDVPGEIGWFYLVEGVDGFDLADYDEYLSGTITDETMAWSTQGGFLPVRSPMYAVRAYVAADAMTSLLVGITATEESAGAVETFPGEFRVVPPVTLANPGSAPYSVSGSWYTAGWMVQGNRRIRPRIRQRQRDDFRQRQNESRQRTTRAWSYI